MAGYITLGRLFVVPRLPLVLVTILLALGFARPCVSDAGELADEGQLIYRTAVRSDGSAIPALVQNDVPLPPPAGACSNCHRRSGHGISEGGSRSLNLTAPELFNPTDKPPVRPAYDDQTLIRAIVAGITPDGRELEVTMPRYELGADDAAALTAYLRSLGATPADGVSESDIVIATVIAENAPATERDAVTQVMPRYFELKNAESRRESQRAAASDRHFWGREHQRAFRTWRLQIWNLEGKASTWRRQLESYYAENKPFAILSGTAGSNWLPVHEFCAASEVACILPLSQSPTGDNADFYSLYYSTGATLEAEVTADHIATAGVPTDAKILVVHQDDDTSRAAFGVFQDALHAKEFKNLRAVEVSKRTLTPRRWRSMLRKEKADIVVAWLPVDSISGLADPSIGQQSMPKYIYTAHAFSDWQSDAATADFPVERIRHAYPYSLPVRGAAQFPREDLWLKQRGLAELDPASASRVLYACRVLGLGLAKIQSNFSREYLLEALEHALDGTQFTSVYPRTTIGPDQRLLSRGTFVVGVSRDQERPFVSPVWIQP
jgi:hypothetical protein